MTELYPEERTPGPGDYSVKTFNSVPVSSFPKEQRFSDSSDTEGSGAGASAPLHSEFKVPSAPKTKKKSWKKVASVQTDIVGETATTKTSSEFELQLKDQNEKLATLKDELAASAEQSAKERKDLKEKNFQQLNELISTQSALEKAVVHSAGLKSELKSTKSLLEECLEAKSNLALELSEVTESNKSYETELSLVKASLDAEKDCAHKLQTDLNEIKLSQKAEVKDLQQQLKELSGVKDGLSEQVDYQQQTIKLQDESITALTTSLTRETELRATTEAALKNKNETITCLKSTISALQQQISEWERVTDGSAQRQHQLEQQVSSTATSLNTLTDQLQQLKLANQQSRSQNENLQSTNQSSAENIASLKISVANKDEEISTLTERLDRVKNLQGTVREKEAKIEELLDLNTLLSSKLDDTKSLRKQIASLDDMVTRIVQTHKEEISSYEGMLAEARTERDVVEQKKLELEVRLNQQEGSHVALKQQYSDHVVSLQTKLSSVQQVLAEKDAELVRHTADLREERDAAMSDAATVQALYNELQEKIAPFKEQLDAYELERKSLEGQTKNWASEAAKATQEYAKLLGHQNQKQKIRRINQISDENITLKQEVMNLRSGESKLKRQLAQHQDKIRQLEGKKRFDSGKAFQRADNSENDGAQRAPLKPYNTSEHK